MSKSTVGGYINKGVYDHVYRLGVSLEKSEPDRNRLSGRLEDDHDEYWDVGDEEGPADKIYSDDGADVRHERHTNRQGVYTDGVHYLYTGEEDDYHGYSYKHYSKYFSRVVESSACCRYVVGGGAYVDHGRVGRVRTRDSPVQHRDGDHEPDD